MLILFELCRYIKLFLDILGYYGINCFNGLNNGLNLMQEKNLFFVGTGAEKMAGLFQDEAQESNQDVNKFTLVGVFGKSYVEYVFKSCKLS